MLISEKGKYMKIPNVGAPQAQVFWSLQQQDVVKRCTGTINADVVIIGGGMAGLSAAQAFRQRGATVVLLEQYFCGSGASGKSSGFITPNSEIDLAHLQRRHGVEFAHKMWEFTSSGVTYIEQNIKKYNLTCDYRVQDTLILANDRSGEQMLQLEHQTRRQMGYPSTMYAKNELGKIIGSREYLAAQYYGGSFGINAYAYCQGMKNVLIDEGVDIYEDTLVIGLGNHEVKTSNALVKANHIIVCADWAIPDLGRLTHEIYHAQNFLLVSTPLSDMQVHKIFPGDNMMAWDSDLIYQYFRIIGDNRLLVGGGPYIETYAKKLHYNAPSAYKKLTTYFHKKFPEVKPQFEYMWPGFIGISKDVVGIAGTDPNDQSLYYVGAATGLPWAAALGNYSAEHIMDKRTDLDHVFSPTRKFPLGRVAEFFLGKRATFALSNLITLKFQ